MINKRNDFDFIINNDVVYLDSATTTVKPNIVNTIVNKYLQCPLTNKGVSKYSRDIQNKINLTRETVKNFINAKNTSEIIFTSGSTESSIIIKNLIYPLLNNEDEIILCTLDHQSTISPWIKATESLKTNFNRNVKIKDLIIDPEGDYREQDLIDKVNKKTKIVILTHIHNIYGLEVNIKYLSKQIKLKNDNCKIILDASQSVGHIEIDVQKLDIDFMYFSGHKMFSLPGIGVLYTQNCNNKNYEVGTLNIPGILSLNTAIDYINDIGIKNIEQYIYKLTRYLFDELSKLKGIIFNNGIAKAKCAVGFGIISFKFENTNTSDIMQVLDDYNIVVRGGNFCNSANDDYIRVSLHIYNNKEDINKLINVLKYISD